MVRVWMGGEIRYGRLIACCLGCIAAHWLYALLDMFCLRLLCLASSLLSFACVQVHV